LRQSGAEAVHSHVDVVVAGLDEAVGVQAEETSLGQFQLYGLEGDSQPDTQWGSAGQVGE
jgi:hypothetical protein